jgi:TolA-binding protein
MLRRNCQICFGLWVALAAALALADDATDQFAVANAHYAAERWQLAIEEFETFLSRHADHEKADVARYYLGESLLQSNRLEDARNSFVQLAVDKPKSKLQLAALFRLGETEFFLNNEAPSRKHLETYLSIADATGDEHLLHAYSYLAELDLRAKHFQQAQERFERASKSNDAGLAAECRFGIARALEGIGDVRKAVRIYEELAADAYGPLSERAQLQLGVMHNAAGDYTSAVAVFDRFVASHAESKLLPEARLARGWALFKLEKYHDARSELAKIPDASDLVGEAKYWEARSWMVQENWTAALESLAAASKAGKASLAGAIAFHEGESLRHLERWDEAVVKFDGVLGDASSREYADDAHFGKLQIAIKRQQHSQAIELAKNFLSAFPDSLLNVAVECRSTIAVCQARLGQFSQAEDALAELIAKHPQSDLIPPTTYNVAEAAYRADERVLAGKLFGMLTTDANSAEWVSRGLAGIAWCQLKSEDLAASARTFERLLKEHPGDPLAASAALLRGQALEKLEQDDAALAMYRRVVHDYPKSRELPQAMFRAALLHDKLKQTNDAATFYQKLLTDHPDFADRPKVLYQFGCLQAERGKAREAEELWQAIRSRHADSDVWDDATYRLAAAALETQHVDDCRKLLGELANRPADETLRPYVLFLEGRLAAATERWADVAAPLERLVSQHAGHELSPAATFWICESAYRRGDHTAAEEKLARLELQLTTGPLAPHCRLRHAQALAQLGKWSHALKVAEAIARDYPQFESQHEADYLIGRALANQAEFNGAREAYHRVIRSSHGSKSETAAMAQFMIGESYFHQGDFAAALRAYLKVEILYAYSKWQAAALLQAGKCHEQLGQWDQATKAYSKLLTTYRDSEVAEEASQRLGLAQQNSGHQTK